MFNSKYLFFIVGIIIMITFLNPIIQEFGYLETEGILLSVNKSKDTLPSFVFKYTVDTNDFYLTHYGNEELVNSYDNYTVLYDSNNPSTAKMKFNHTNEMYLILGLIITLMPILMNKFPFKKNNEHLPKNMSYSLILKLGLRCALPIIAIIVPILALVFIVGYDFKYTLIFEEMVLLLIIFIICIIGYILIDKSIKKTLSTIKQDQN